MLKIYIIVELLPDDFRLICAHETEVKALEYIKELSKNSTSKFIVKQMDVIQTSSTTFTNRIPVSIIKNEAAKYFQIDDIDKYTRKQPYPTARDISIYLARKFNPKMHITNLGRYYPLPNKTRNQKRIKKFKDHSDICHATKLIKDQLYIKDEIVTIAVEQIERNIISTMKKQTELQPNNSLSQCVILY